MKRYLLPSLMAAALTLPAFAVTDPMVSGGAMYPIKEIIDNAVNSKDHAILVAALKAAGLVTAL